MRFGLRVLGIFCFGLWDLGFLMVGVWEDKMSLGFELLKGFVME